MNFEEVEMKMQLFYSLIFLSCIFVNFNKSKDRMHLSITLMFGILGSELLFDIFIHKLKKQPKI